MINRRRRSIWRAAAVVAGLLLLVSFMAAALAAKGRPAGWARSGRCSPEYPAARGPEYVFIGKHRGQGSPRQVLEKFHKALAAGNVGVCLQCVRGTSAALCYEASVVASDVGAAELYRAVVGRFGRVGWTKFCTVLDPGSRWGISPRFRMLSGRVIPKLKFIYVGSLAHCVWDVEFGVNMPIYFSRRGGHWYIDVNRTHYHHRNRDFCCSAAYGSEVGLLTSHLAGAISSGRIDLKEAAERVNRSLHGWFRDVTRGSVARRKTK